MSDSLTHTINRIDRGVDEIRKIIRAKAPTTNETRIGALRRISNAIGLVNSAIEHLSGLEGIPMSVDTHLKTLKEIKNTLLGE